MDINLSNQNEENTNNDDDNLPDDDVEILAGGGNTTAELSQIQQFFGDATTFTEVTSPLTPPPPVPQEQQHDEQFPADTNPGDALVELAARLFAEMDKTRDMLVSTKADIFNLIFKSNADSKRRHDELADKITQSNEAQLRNHATSIAAQTEAQITSAISDLQGELSATINDFAMNMDAREERNSRIIDGLQSQVSAANGQLQTLSSPQPTGRGQGLDDTGPRSALREDQLANTHAAGTAGAVSGDDFHAVYAPTGFPTDFQGTNPMRLRTLPPAPAPAPAQQPPPPPFPPPPAPKPIFPLSRLDSSSILNLEDPEEDDPSLWSDKSADDPNNKQNNTAQRQTMTVANQAVAAASNLQSAFTKTAAAQSAEFSKSMRQSFLPTPMHSSNNPAGRPRYVYNNEDDLVARLYIQKQLESLKMQSIAEQRALRVAQPFKHPEIRSINNYSYQQFMSAAIAYDSDLLNTPLRPMQFFSKELRTRLHGRHVRIMQNPQLCARFGIVRVSTPDLQILPLLSTEQARGFIETTLICLTIDEHQTMLKATLGDLFAEHGFPMGEPVSPGCETALFQCHVQAVKETLRFLELSPQFSYAPTARGVPPVKNPAFPVNKEDAKQAIDGYPKMIWSWPGMNNIVQKRVGPDNALKEVSLSLYLDERLKQIDRSSYTGPMKLGSTVFGSIAIDLGHLLTIYHNLQHSDGAAAGSSALFFASSDVTTAGASTPRITSSYLCVDPTAAIPKQQPRAHTSSASVSQQQQQYWHHQPRSSDDRARSSDMDGNGKRKTTMVHSSSTAQVNAPPAPSKKPHYHPYNQPKGVVGHFHASSRQVDRSPHEEDDAMMSHHFHRTTADAYDHQPTTHDEYTNSHYDSYVEHHAPLQPDEYDFPTPTYISDEEDINYNSDTGSEVEAPCERHAGQWDSDPSHQYDRSLTHLAAVSLNIPEDFNADERQQQLMLAAMEQEHQQQHRQQQSSFHQRHDQHDNSPRQNATHAPQYTPRSDSNNLPDTTPDSRRRGTVRFNDGRQPPNREQGADTKTLPCLRFMQNNCRMGEKCSFSHDEEVISRALRYMLNCQVIRNTERNERVSAEHSRFPSYRPPPPLPPPPPPPPGEHARRTPAVQHASVHEQRKSSGDGVHSSAARSDSASTRTL